MLKDLLEPWRNNTHHRTIKMKPIDVKSAKYIDTGVENNKKDLKFKVRRIEEYQNIKTFL